jgi:hypothetical protein
MWDGRECRDATSSDLAAVGRLCDHLEKRARRDGDGAGRCAGALPRLRRPARDAHFVDHIERQRFRVHNSYLETEHTLRHFKEEFFQPRILNPRNRAKSPQPLAEVAHEQAAAIVAGDRSEKTGRDERDELRRIEQRHLTLALVT